jgi:protein involved in polysaccharide export with SLBB domain
MNARPVALVALLWLVAAPPTLGAAQQVNGAVSPGLRATRPALELLAQRLEAVERTPDSSQATRDWARSQAATVRTRLAVGDFQAGDRILIWVDEGGGAADAAAGRRAPAERSIEQQLSDTFTVGTDRDVTLPAIGIVSLSGVLRSELPAHLTREIGRFINDPVVHVRALIRVSVVGAVAKPGFYAVPVDAVLSDAVMIAGGLAPEAKLHELRIERFGRPLWRGPMLQVAMADGRTLDEMNLRAGDQFIVPGGRHSDPYGTVRTVSLLLSIPITIYTLTRIF